MARIYKVFGGASIVLLAALWMIGAALPARAADALYTIEGVKVDVTAENAAQAREQAFNQAQTEAFTALAGRIMPESEMATFTPPDTDTISNMVEDFEITEERLSHVRYMATYIFRFKDSDVQAYFNHSGKTYTDVASRPMLVLPFYQWGSRMVLWDGDNPWLTAWTRVKSYAGLVPVTVPIGDAQDVSDIADNQALTYQQEAMDAMLTRYNAGDALIAIATPMWPDTMQNVAADAVPHEVAVMLYRTGTAGPQFITTVKVTPAADDTLATLYDRAVDTVRQALQKDWKERTVAAPQSDNKLQARVQIASMNEWVETQKALNRAQGVENIKLVKLSPQEARIELTFRGTENRLRLALAQVGITLSQPQVSFAGTTDLYGRNDNNPYANPMAMPGSPLIYDLYLNQFRMPQR
jgi:hypothetical protein